MRNSFKIPLQSEVQAYMKEKMGWPDSFCKHYAEKFWNHYQASGWKLSSGNSVKDWKACFNSQWQKPKFKEDIEMLFGKSVSSFNGAVKASEISSQATIREIAELDKILEVYRKHPTSVPFSSLGAFYPYMKAEKLLRPFYPQEVENLKRVYNNDTEKCRCACVLETLNWYTNKGWTFQFTMEVRLKFS